MNKPSRTKQLVAAALCVALGVILPQAFHMIPNAGAILLPMHIPVLLCGLLCGWQYGLIAGIMTPLISALLTGMPGAVVLPSMVCELAVYGLAAGLLYARLTALGKAARIYASLIPAMLAGRAVAGVLNALIFRAGAYSLQVWATASFVTGIPGIVVQLLLIPALVAALVRSRVVSVGHAAPAPDAACMEKAKALIKTQEVCIVVIQNHRIAYQGNGRGVSNLLKLLDTRPELLRGATVVDTVVGKAAAMLLVLGGAKRVYGEMASAAAKDYLAAHGIPLEYGRCIDMIRNRERNGLCPMEQTVWELDDPAEAKTALEKKLASLQKTG